MDKKINNVFGTVVAAGIAAAGVANAQTPVSEAELLGQFKAFQVACVKDKSIPTDLTKEERVDNQLKCFAALVAKGAPNYNMSVAGNFTYGKDGKVSDYSVGNVWLGEKIDGKAKTSTTSQTYSDVTYFRVSKDDPKLEVVPDVVAPVAKKPVAVNKAATQTVKKSKLVPQNQQNVRKNSQIRGK
jgi:hypothetical protein